MTRALVFTFRTYGCTEEARSAILRTRLRSSLRWLERALDSPNVDDSDLHSKLSNRRQQLKLIEIGLETDLDEAVMHYLSRHGEVDVCQGCYIVWSDWRAACRAVVESSEFPDLVLEVTRYDPLETTAVRTTFFPDGRSEDLTMGLTETTSRS